MLRRPTAAERSVRIALVAMILGSVTLGLIFDTRWNVFGTGLGGETGIFAARFMHDTIGLVGSGRTETLRVIFGVDKAQRGKIVLSFFRFRNGFLRTVFLDGCIQKAGASHDNAGQVFRIVKFQAGDDAKTVP